jgi:hypothetical protein
MGNHSDYFSTLFSYLVSKWTGILKTQSRYDFETPICGI